MANADMPERAPVLSLFLFLSLSLYHCLSISLSLYLSISLSLSHTHTHTLSLSGDPGAGLGVARAVAGPYATTLQTDTQSLRALNTSPPRNRCTRYLAYKKTPHPRTLR